MRVGGWSGRREAPGVARPQPTVTWFPPAAGEAQPPATPAPATRPVAPHVLGPDGPMSSARFVLRVAACDCVRGEPVVVAPSLGAIEARTRDRPGGDGPGGEAVVRQVHIAAGLGQPQPVTA
jgi:hypothetical protein